MKKGTHFFILTLLFTMLFLTGESYAQQSVKTPEKNVPQKRPLRVFSDQQLLDRINDHGALKNLPEAEKKLLLRYITDDDDDYGPGFYQSRFTKKNHCIGYCNSDVASTVYRILSNCEPTEVCPIEIGDDCHSNAKVGRWAPRPTGYERCVPPAPRALHFNRVWGTKAQYQPPTYLPPPAPSPLGQYQLSPRALVVLREHPTLASLANSALKANNQSYKAPSNGVLIEIEKLELKMGDKGVVVALTILGETHEVSPDPPISLQALAKGGSVPFSYTLPKQQIPDIPGRFVAGGSFGGSLQFDPRTGAIDLTSMNAEAQVSHTVESWGVSLEVYKDTIKTKVGDITGKRSP